MRISDWSSDVCSSDLHGRLPERGLDCVGLAALVLGRAAPEGYGLRSGDEGQAADWLRAAGLRRVDAAREGDLALVRPGPLQLHLMIVVPGGPVHRSEARRVGEGWVSTCRIRGAPMQ